MDRYSEKTEVGVTSVENVFQAFDENIEIFQHVVISGKKESRNIYLNKDTAKKLAGMINTKFGE